MKKNLNKRGIALILSYLVIAAFMVLFIGGGFVPRSINESFHLRRHDYSTVAYWLAEAGIANAVKQLPSTNPITSTPVNVGTGVGYFSATLTQPSAASYDIVSTGDFNNIYRTIYANIEVPSFSFGGISNAIETTGDLNIKGSVDINPSGSVETYSSASFDSVFGLSKEEIKAAASHLYVDPPANQQPIEGITWVDLTGDTPATAAKYSISSNWSGSGLLIIDGHRNSSTEDITALEISGTWNFNGLIWVIGKIKLSGTPVINGALFAESAVEVESDVTGNVTLNFSASDVEGAFNLLSSGLSNPRVRSWHEL